MPEKLCRVKADDLRIWSGTITPAIAEIWSLLLLHISVYTSL